MTPLHECDKAIDKLSALVEGWDNEPFSAITYDADSNRQLVRYCLLLVKALRSHLMEAK